MAPRMTPAQRERAVALGEVIEQAFAHIGQPGVFIVPSTRMGYARGLKGWVVLSLFDDEGLRHIGHAAVDAEGYLALFSPAGGVRVMEPYPGYVTDSVVATLYTVGPTAWPTLEVERPSVPMIVSGSSYTTDTAPEALRITLVPGEAPHCELLVAGGVAPVQRTSHPAVGWLWAAALQEAL